MTNNFVQLEIDYSTNAAANKGAGKEQIVQELVNLGVARPFIFADILTFKIFVVCTSSMYSDIVWWFTKAASWEYSYINVKKLQEYTHG